MSVERGIFKVNFDEYIKDYGAKDGLISIIYYVYDMILIYLFALLMFKTNVYKDFGTYLNLRNEQLYKFIFYFPLAIIQVAPIFIYIKIKNHSVRSLGLKTNRNIKSIILGILFSIPFTLPTIFYAIMHQAHFISMQVMIWLFLYLFIEIAFVEELSFRGFLQTRIQGLIKKKWLSIIIVGIMFGLMHIPFQMFRSNMPLTQFIVTDSVHLITTCVIHIYLVYLYTRDNNIISSTVAHTLIDFIPSIFI